MPPAIGYALWEQNRPILSNPVLDAVEITFERADDPLRVECALGDLDCTYVSIHALRLSPASPEPPAPAYLAALRAVVEENGAAAVSDHLGFTRDREGGIEIGHFAPPPFTPDALRATCRNIAVIQDYFSGLPFFLENIAYLFRFKGSMTEAEFLIRVLESTGCGWLLDVTNLYANARNHGFDPEAFLHQVVPAAPRLQMHLSGGFHDEQSGMYLDSHSRPVPDDVWDLYRLALRLARGKVDAVFIERDHDFPDTAGWLAEAGRARRVAEEVEAQP